MCEQVLGDLRTASETFRRAVSALADIGMQPSDLPKIRSRLGGPSDSAYAFTEA